MTAAPTPGPWLTLSCPQCRPRANCDGCALSRPAHPHTRAAGPAVNGQAALVGCSTGRGRRHAAEFSKSPTPCRLGKLFRTVTVSDSLLQNLLFIISCNTNSVVCRAFLVSFPANRLVLSARLSTRCTSLAPSTFNPALAPPAAPLPHPLSVGSANFPAVSSSLSFSFSRHLPFAGPRSSSSPLFFASRVCPVRASAQPVRMPAGHRTARWPGLRGGGDVTTGDVTSPPGVPPGPPAQVPSC